MSSNRAGKESRVQFDSPAFLWLSIAVKSPMRRRVPWKRTQFAKRNCAETYDNGEQGVITR
jgi:hypothetical protein